jgi:hypothetical protein
MGDASDRSSRDTMSRDFRDSFGRDARDSFGRRDSFERLSGEGASLSRRRRPSRDDLDLPSPRRSPPFSERSLEDFGGDRGDADGDTRERPRLPRSNSEPRKSFNELQRTVSLWDAAALGDVPLCRDALALLRAAKESEIPNFKGSDLGHFPLVSADFWTNDHLSERSRSVDAFSGTRARGTLTLKRR